MRLRSFAGRLLILLVLLVGAGLLSSTLAALKAADSNVRALVAEDVTVRARVAALAMTQQAETLQQQVAVITEDFGFRAAAATGDRDTILSALANHGERVDADLALWVTPEGKISLASSPMGQLPSTIRRAMSRGTPQSAAAIEAIAGKVYYLGISPSLAPSLLGWLVIGKEIDAPELARLEQLTGATINLAPGEPGEAEAYAPASPQKGRNTAGTWVRQSIDLDELTANDAPLEAEVALSLLEALANFDGLRLQLIAIALTALGLSTLIAIAAARWLSAPISRLVRTAQAISNGDYSRTAAVDTGTELDSLGIAIDTMRQAVSDRESRIRHQALHDLLTQLPNRNHLHTLYNRYLVDNPQRTAFAVALLELDNLSQLRDLYGSDFADEVLRETAQRIALGLRRGDFAGRVADHQILLFLQELDTHSVSTLTDKLAEVIGPAMLINGVPVTVEARTGFAFSPAHGTDFDDLLRRSQLALAEARRSGRVSATYELGKDEHHLRQIRIAGRLQSAIDDNAFELFYQPKYHVREEKICGAEALLRWQDEELGSVYPDEFIPVAEQTGMITALSAWVVDRAVRDQQHWRASGIDLSTSVNLSGKDVMNRAFVDSIMVQIREAQLPPEALVLEVTETAMMSDVEVARENMERVQQLGMRISIDDYGTGFSSLAQLRTLPVRELKLDRSLVEHIDTEEADRLIASSTIDMAHHLGLEVVAEGVETPQIFAMLRNLNCEIVQGYLIAKPMPATLLLDFLKQESWRHLSATP